jgi:hypothetical protein
VSFEGLSDGEIGTFRKTLALRRVEIPGKGSYDDVSLEDVPICPESNNDAQRWAMSRFEHRLTADPSYRSRAAVRELFAELTEGTPLEEFAPTLPAHQDLLEKVAKDPARFWSLAAPVDLAPYPVPDGDRAALRIGSAAPDLGESLQSTGVVRVPYRGGWSMRKLIDRLLSGTTPRKVLLCDRYVRGDDNLATLKILFQAVRAVGPACAFEVWTGDEDADFKQLRSITGTAPRSYREVFGRSLPHDRYLLVLPTQGPGFGWQMSNSPIHARADVHGASADSPLRWKDLSGARVSADELEPALSQWLKGGGR